MQQKAATMTDTTTQGSPAFDDAGTLELVKVPAWEARHKRHENPEELSHLVCCRDLERPPAASMIVCLANGEEFEASAGDFARFGRSDRNTVPADWRAEQTRWLGAGPGHIPARQTSWTATGPAPAGIFGPGRRWV